MGVTELIVHGQVDRCLVYNTYFFLFDDQRLFITLALSLLEHHYREDLPTAAVAAVDVNNSSSAS